MWTESAFQSRSHSPLSGSQGSPLVQTQEQASGMAWGQAGVGAQGHDGPQARGTGTAQWREVCLRDPGGDRLGLRGQC